MTIFSTNLKRLRLAKKLTQEQAAEALGMSAQSISRWECGATLPDVTMLPAIARLYCVSIDDLYRENAVAYDNYARRLLSVYRSTMLPEDFARADQEFRKLQRSGAATPEDLRQFGILHQYMLSYCIQQAETLFDAAIEAGDVDVHWRARRQKLYFLSLIGKSAESIAEQCEKIERGCDDLQEWICLIAACQYAGEFQEAYDWFLKAAGKFPEAAMLYVYGGDICRRLKRYEEAFHHWDRALMLDATLCDAQHSKAFCLEELGEWEKACNLWRDIAASQERNGFDVEAARSRKRAGRCREHLQPSPAES